MITTGTTEWTGLKIGLGLGTIPVFHQWTRRPHAAGNLLNNRQGCMLDACLPPSPLPLAGAAALSLSFPRRRAVTVTLMHRIRQRYSRLINQDIVDAAW